MHQYEEKCQVWKRRAKGSRLQVSQTRWYSAHSHNVGRVHALRKCLVNAMSLKTREGGAQFWKQRCGNICIYSYYTFHPTRLASGWHAIWYCFKKFKSQKDRSNHQLPCEGSSRGATIELLLHDNRLEIPIPDCSWLVLKEGYDWSIVYEFVYPWRVEVYLCVV